MMFFFQPTTTETTTELTTTPSTTETTTTVLITHERKKIPSYLNDYPCHSCSLRQQLRLQRPSLIAATNLPYQQELLQVPTILTAMTGKFPKSV